MVDHLRIFFVYASACYCTSFSMLLYQFQHAIVPVSACYCTSFSILLNQLQHIIVPVSTCYCTSSWINIRKKSLKIPKTV